MLQQQRESAKGLSTPDTEFPVGKKQERWLKTNALVDSSALAGLREGAHPATIGSTSWPLA